MMEKQLIYCYDSIDLKIFRVSRTNYILENSQYSIGLREIEMMILKYFLDNINSLILRNDIVNYIYGEIEPAIKKFKVHLTHIRNKISSLNILDISHFNESFVVARLIKEDGLSEIDFEISYHQEDCKIYGNYSLNKKWTIIQHIPTGKYVKITPAQSDIMEYLLDRITVRIYRKQMIYDLYGGLEFRNRLDVHFCKLGKILSLIGLGIFPSERLLYLHLDTIK